MTIPLIPAKTEWLDGWVGPVTRVTGYADSVPLPGSIGMTTGTLSTYRELALVYWPSAKRASFRPVKELALDPMREEVQDRLVRQLGPQALPVSIAGLPPWQAVAVLIQATTGAPPRGIANALDLSHTTAVAGCFAGRDFQWSQGYIDGKHNWLQYSGRCQFCGMSRPEDTVPVECPGVHIGADRGWSWGYTGDHKGEVLFGLETGDAAIVRLHQCALDAGYLLLLDATTLQLPNGILIRKPA